MAIEFISDSEAPEGFMPKPRQSGGRLSPTAEDLKRMAQPRTEPTIYTIKNRPPVELQGRIAVEPARAWNAIPLAEATAGIVAIMERAEAARRARVKRDLEEAPRQRLMRELIEIQAAREAKVAPAEEVKTDERSEQTGSKAEEPAKRVRVGTKGPARTRR